MAELTIRPDEIRNALEDRLKDARQDRDDRIAEIRHDRDVRLAELLHERDYLREAVSVGQEAQRVMLAQMEDLLDANRTSHAALQSIAAEGAATHD